MQSREGDIGIAKALELLHHAATPHGFVASVTETDNYKRIWGRDGVIVSLAALQTSEEKLKQAAYNTLRTLRDKQGPHGEIPSNVDTATNHVSYGGTAGRVDPNLWFIIGCHSYWQRTHDEAFLNDFLPCLRRIQFLLGAWEFNTKGLLYIPETGDWADEFLQHGYVLYDQLLYYQALRSLRDLYHVAHDPNADALLAKAELLRELITVNYWFYECDPDISGAYHPVIFKRGCDLAAEQNDKSYWMSFFSPTGYGYRFDAMANVLVSLFGIADDNQRKLVDEHIANQVATHEQVKVLAAFTPVITPVDADWKDLQSTFSNTFKNQPHEYHNGGLWPLINGFYVADLAQRGRTELAREYLEGIHVANKMDTAGDEWGFHEYIHGTTLEPGGTRHQTWSASAAIMGHYALSGHRPLLDQSN